MPSIPVSRTLLALALSALVGLAGAGCADTETDTRWLLDRCVLDRSKLDRSALDDQPYRSTQPDTDLREPAGRSHESHHHHR